VSNHVRGHRGAQGDIWKWGQDESVERRPDPGRRRTGLLAILLSGLGALAAIAVLAIFIAPHDEEATSGAPFPTGSRTAASPLPTSSRTATASATPPTLTPSDSASFAVWSRQEIVWRSGGLPHQPVYSEGDLLPLMVRINRATAGAIYEIELWYQCQLGDAAAFDYLGGVSAADAATILVQPGPGRRPDSTLPLPDDPSISFDNIPERLVQIWGATFYQPPQGPSPTTACSGQKLLSLTILAQDETVFLILGAHLASSAEWGSGKAAAALAESISLEVSVNGLPTREVTVPPQAIIR